jgi:prepilin-type N-terminal cleavage/methylation domain-containing protein
MREKVRQGSNAFTLVEIVAVVAILSIIALLVVTRVQSVVERAKISAAESDLVTIRDAFVSLDSGYLRDMGGIPGFSVGYLRIANLMTPTNLFGSLDTEEIYKSGFRIDDELKANNPVGCADDSKFLNWDEEAQRGWRGPYIKAWLSDFPIASSVRFKGDSSFGERGFFPPLDGLRLPDEIVSSVGGCSVYGFPGEPSLTDPWGNPYVLQIPPAQAFEGRSRDVSDEMRFHYARVVSAGPDGILSTPCFALNLTNRWESSWNDSFRRLSRQAGREGLDVSARGDDIVLFLRRNDTDEGDK